MNNKTHIAYVIATSKNRGWNININDIEDIVQDAYMSALEKDQRIDASEFTGYLVISMLRFVQKRARSKSTPTPNKELNRFMTADSIGHATEQSDDIRCLLENIKSLPDYLQRDLADFLNGLSTAQIAEKNGMKRSTVSVNICRAKEILAKLMKKAA